MPVPIHLHSPINLLSTRSFCSTHVAEKCHCTSDKGSMTLQAYDVVQINPVCEMMWWQRTSCRAGPPLQGQGTVPWQGSSARAGHGRTALQGQGTTATAQSVENVAGYFEHMGQQRRMLNGKTESCLKLGMLPVDGNSTALLQLFAGLVCQSPQLATTAVRNICTALLAGPYITAENWFLDVTFDSTTSHSPCSSCTISATCHLATFCAVLRLFYLQCNTIMFWA